MCSRQPFSYLLSSVFGSLNSTHNLQSALEMGNRTLMMDRGRIVLDLSAEERAGLTVDDLLHKFKQGAGRILDNDRILLS